MRRGTRVSFSRGSRCGLVTDCGGISSLPGTVEMSGVRRHRPQVMRDAGENPTLPNLPFEAMVAVDPNCEQALTMDPCEQP